MREIEKPADAKKLRVMLCQYRKKAGMSQAVLAKQLGASQSFVSKYEQGDGRLSYLEVRVICQVLGVSFVEFTQVYEERGNAARPKIR